MDFTSALDLTLIGECVKKKKTTNKITKTQTNPHLISWEIGICLLFCFV